MYLTLAELRAAKRTLLRNNARPVRSEGNKFVVITSPDALYDLEGMFGFALLKPLLINGETPNLN